MLLEWDKSISTGCDYIDEEHKEIFNIMNVIFDKIASRDFEKINDLLLNMVIYASDHLSHEEEIFLKYKGINSDIDEIISQHEHEHSLFLKNTIDMIKEYRDGNNVAVKLALFVKNWISNHISVDDLFLFNKINSL